MITQLTQAQQDAMNKAYALLGEHFDYTVIAVAWDATTQQDDQQREAKAMYFKGSFIACIGLASWAHHMMLNEPPDKPRECSEGGGE